MKVSARLSPTSWLTAKTVFSQLFAVALFAIQAPILGPRAFGLMSMVMVFISFCEAVPCEAAADALLSVRQAEQEHFDSMNTAIMGLSLLFGLIVLIGAHWFAHWFGEPELVPMLRVMAILPAISALAAAPTAATKRDMQFGPLAARSIGSLLIGGVIGLVLTLLGAGAWALIWQAFFTRVGAAMILWYGVPLRIRFGFSSRHLRDLLHFALPTLLSRVMTWSSAQFPRAVLGVSWGAAQLGLFSMAGRFSDILMEVAVVPRYAVARVELRKLATSHAELVSAARRLLTLMSAFCFPLCVGGAMVIPTLFHVWLDSRWFGAIFPTQLLLLGCMALITYYGAGAILLAMNNQKAEAGSSLAQTASMLLVVALAAPFGVAATAAAIALRLVVLLALPIMLLRRCNRITASTVLGAQAPALVASAIMGAIVWTMRTQLERYLSDAVLLPLLIAAGIVIYVGLAVSLVPSLAREMIGRAHARA